MSNSKREFSSHILAQLQRNQQRVWQSITEGNWYIVLPNGEPSSSTTSLIRGIASQPELLRSKIAQLPRDKSLELVKNQDDMNGNTALHCAAPNSESLQLLLELYPLNDRREAAEVKNINGYTVLHKALVNPISLGTIFSIYQDNEQRLTAIQLKTKDNNTSLHLAVAYPDSFQMLWGQYSPDQKTPALEQTNNNGETVLHSLVTSNETSPELLSSVLQIYSEKNLVSALKAKTKTSDNVLSLALKKPQLLKVIVESLSREGLLDILSENKFGVSFLEYHSSSATLPNLLQRLPHHDRLELVLNKNFRGKNLLDEKESSLQALQALLAIFPDAKNWIRANKHGKLDFLPIFKSEHPCEKIAEMLILYNNIQQLANYGTDSASHLANNLTQQLNEFVIAKGVNPQREAEVRQAFSTALREGYKNLRTQGGFITAILINIAMAATIVGLPIVLGKLYITGCGFFTQTHSQKITCSIESVFHEIVGKEPPSLQV